MRILTILQRQNNHNPSPIILVEITMQNFFKCNDATKETQIISPKMVLSSFLIYLHGNFMNPHLLVISYAFIY